MEFSILAAMGFKESSIQQAMAEAARRPDRITHLHGIIEILINTPTVSERIFKGEFHDLKALMEKSRELGMRTFDWALFELYNLGHISYEEAIRNADSANELRLNIKLKSTRGSPPTESNVALSIHHEPEPESAAAEGEKK